MVGGLFLGQRSLLYQPDRSRPRPAEYGIPEMAEVTVRTGDGLDLLAWWRGADDPRAPVLLFLHGNAGHIGHRAGKIRQFLERGWGALLLSWRGYAGNPGQPTEPGLLSDAAAARRYLAERGVAAQRIVLYGESLGSGPAVRVAAETEVAALVLEAPFTSITDLARRLFPYVPVRRLVKDRFASIERIGGLSVPVLIVHGERDLTVPVSHGRKLLAAVPGAKAGHFVPEAGHNDLYAFGVDAVVAEFVERHAGRNEH